MSVLNESFTRSRTFRQDYVRLGTRYTQNFRVDYTETRNGEPVPDYQRKIIKRQEAGSSYTRTGVTWHSVGDLVAKVVITDFPYSPLVTTEYISAYQAFNVLPGTGLPSNSSKLDAMCLAKFLSNAVEKARPFMGGVFIGELRQTLEMIRSPFRSLRQLISRYLTAAAGIRRVHERRVTRILADYAKITRRQSKYRLRKRIRIEIDRANKALRGAWLEYHLGVIPLVADIENAVNVYANLIAKPQYVRAYAKVEDSASVVMEDHFETVPSLWSVKTFAKETSSEVVKYRGAFEVKINTSANYEDSLAQFQRLAGFRLWDVIPTIYELIPYSFVVDYVSNLGNIINGVEALTFNWVWKSRSRKTSVLREAHRVLDLARMRTSFGSRPCNPLVSRSSPSIVEIFRYQRDVPILTVPPLVFDFGKPNSEQWITILALIAKAKTFSLSSQPYSRSHLN